MKTNTFKSTVLAFFLFATMVLSSCQDDEKSPISNDPGKKEKADQVLAFRKEMDFINRFVEENVMGSSAEDGRLSFGRSTLARLKSFSPCATATEEELEDGSIKVILNFGEGCETEEGREVAGKVVMIFAFQETGIEYSLEFINYSELNSGEDQGNVINGTVFGSFLIDMEEGTFIQEMEQELTTTYPNNTDAIYRIAQHAEMTEEGLRVTAMTTSGNFADGGQFTITVSKALLYDFSCEGDLPVQGEEMLSFQGNTIKVNYGNGNCDNTYTVK